MSARHARRPLDPDLDRSPASSPILLDSYFEQYQRLVSNPFLALTALVPWFAAIRHALATKHVPSILVLLTSLFGVAWLLQFHCRDCGATGTLLRWRRHACEAALDRQRARVYRRFRGPNPVVQTALWGLAVLTAAFLATLVLLL